MAQLQRQGGAEAAIGSASPLVAPREFQFSEADFRYLSNLAYENAGIVLSQNKYNLVYSRLSRRLRALNLHSFQDYREYLSSNSQEIENFINSISTNHTKFFRESHHFDHLRSGVLVPFLQQAPASRNNRFRIWSAGCSSGEEPYTIASVVRRELRDAPNLDLKILATDIDTDILGKAERGEFQAPALADVPKQYQEYFQESGGKLKMSRKVKDLITFRQLNLLQPWPFKGPFDVIFCRT